MPVATIPTKARRGYKTQGGNAGGDNQNQNQNQNQGNQNTGGNTGKNGGQGDGNQNQGQQNQGQGGQQNGQNQGQKGDSNELTIDELQDHITSSVETALKNALDDANKDKVTTENLKQIVSEVLKEREVEAKKVTNDSIKEIVGDVFKRQWDEIRKPKKAVHNPDEAKGRGGDGVDGHDIEITEGWTKGNLPVHGKQLLNAMMQRPMNDGIDERQLAKAVRTGEAMMAKAKAYGVKALTTSGNGDIVPTDLASELQRRVFLESQLAQLWMSREIEMPSPTYELPLNTTRPNFKLNTTENTSVTKSDPGTGKVTLVAKKLMAQTDYSYEIDEDSIVPILQMVQQQLGEAGAADLESAIINGDTAGTHQDSDFNSESNAPEKAWDGLRKLALAVAALNTDISSGGISRANLIALKKAMGKYGRNLRNMVWIVGPNGENDILNLDEVVTIDKRGQQATIVTGMLPSLFGIPIVVSESNREDLNASGVFDNTTTTQGSILLVNHSRFLLGNRRGFTIETDRDISTQTNQIVASFRKAFVPIETPSATVTNLHLGFNYTA